MSLTRQQRFKRAQIMKRNAPKISAARKRMANRKPNLDQLKSRATKRARSLMFKKLAKGKDKTEMSVSEIDRIEGILKKRSSAIERLAKKIMSQMRSEKK